MKKFMKTVFVMAVIACLLCTSAFAAGSTTTSTTDVTASSGTVTTATVASGIDINATQASELLKGASKDVPATSLSRVFFYDVTKTDSSATITFKFTGHGYLFHYENNAWVYTGKEGDNSIVYDGSCSPFAVFTTSATSAKTADTVAPFTALGVALVAAAAATFVLRRKEA